MREKKSWIKGIP
jgi:molybdenum cofactor biosynthesis enzyme MoaA